MTEILFSKNGVTISKHTGPAAGDTDRRRYQITDQRAGGYIQLTREQWEALGEWFGRDCAPDCEGPHLDLTWDRAVG